MAKIFLGNAAPIETYSGADAVVHRDGEAPYFDHNIADERHPAVPVRTEGGERDRAVVAARDFDPGPQITTIVREANVADNATREDVILNHVYATKAVFGLHSRKAPMWVASDDHEVAQALAEEFGCALLPADLGALAAEQREAWDRISGSITGPQALMVNGGRDATFDLVFSTGGFTDVGLSANTSTPAGSDTSLTGQITTAGGGLIAKSLTYAHTTGASTATLTGTYTANGSDSLPVTVAKVGLRSASGTGGTFHSSTLLSSTATLSATGDALTVTWTFTLTPS